MTMRAPWLLAGVLLFLFTLTSRGDDWPQWMGPQRDGVWREAGILERFPAGGPRVLWRTRIHGGYSGPAVADGLVYVMDYQTEADTFALSTPVKRARTTGKERVVCLDAKTGKEVWKHVYDRPYEISYPAGPRCTPTVHGGKVYALGAEGNLFCLDAKKGTVLWSRDFSRDYGAKTAMWGYSSHPLVDGKKLLCIVGGKGSLVVAFDKDTGKELWKAGDASEPGYAPPSIIEAGGKRQLIVWDADKISSRDPESGREYWSIELKPNFGMAIMAPRQLGDHLFAGGIGWKSVLIKLAKDRPAAEEVWRGKRDTSVHPVNSTPMLEDGTIYGVDQPGPLTAVDIQTGKRLWATTRPTTGDRPASSGTAFLVKNGDRFFLFNEKGELVIAKLSRKGYEEIDRARILDPTSSAHGRKVVWSHPAFAGKCLFARNDREIVCVTLAK